MNWRVAAGWAKKSSGPEAKMIVKVWEARNGLEQEETFTHTWAREQGTRGYWKLLRAQISQQSLHIVAAPCELLLSG